MYKLTKKEEVIPAVYILSFLFSFLQGCKIKMDDSGNILIKRIAKTNVYVKSTSANGSTSPEETAISNEVLKLANGGLESEKAVKLFDMKKFQQNVTRELKRGYPDRR